ncbi:hypothetical protein HQ529_04165 [Candidatus Woesearchaeota archaeon]|nr:hypothetical protein [Candidatus Woesearchaeota archaeon]
MEIKEKFVGAAGSASGIASILGSWQVCHNLCLGLIALLSVIGITVVGMPLLFLTKLAVPFWIVAVSLLVIVLYFYFKKGCISQKLILFNLGVIIAATPFQSLQSFSPVFWIVGGALVALSIFLFVKDKIKR